ncbi:MAG: Na+/H+ antiporter NhaA [Moraxellaceae bacterium]|jgi:NhaA family Na+:H+ antiporter
MLKHSKKIFVDFFESEKSGGLTLIFFTVVSLILANSAFQETYLGFWENKFGGLSLEHWVNDALMAIFFLLIGLELKREFQIGELSSLKKAALPIFSALGGMLVPALIYLFYNFQQPTANGFGIPMATDIAFALGVLSLLGKRVPLALKVFLTALAVIDDLGAILVIALFYTKTIIWSNLAASLGLFVLLLVFNKLKVKSLLIYIPVGIIMWYFMHHSGIHATITGVLLAFSLPTKPTKKLASPAEITQRFLHFPVPFVILPLFALVNTAISINDDWLTSLTSPASQGIAVGLVIGKTLGIFLFSWLAIKIGFAEKPTGVNWNQLFGVGILGGIGFTMSIFVTLLAFDSPTLINNGKLAILFSSLVAGLIGYTWLSFSLKDKK